MSTLKRECQNCYFWEREENRVNMGQCRHDPPRMFLTPGQMQGNFGFTSTWPLTQPTQWCGKWKGQIITEDLQ